MASPNRLAAVPGFPARLAALRMLDAVLRRGQALEQAMDGAARGVARADDRALAHAIAAETLRRLTDLDALIDSATPRILPPDAKARFALRIALVQALALGTPSHAAIATSLPLVEAGPRRLVHGVFGTLMRQQAVLGALPHLPAHVTERWHAHWGGAALEGLREALAAQPPLDLTLADAEETALWAERLGGISLMPGHVRVAAGAQVSALPGYTEGRWWVQDLAASIPARLLGAGQGRVAYDLCAAPGGKALQLAAAGWQVTAIDRSERRIVRLKENSARTGLALSIKLGDARNWHPETPAQAILLDAPCSATGIYRRHPDVIHRIDKAEIDAMAALQRQMLPHAARQLDVGGRLIYATCSLEPDEGEAQIEALLAADERLALDPITPAELPVGLAPHLRGWLRTLPVMLADKGGVDGFFIARLVRR